jgi:hypothetical protein
MGTRKMQNHHGGMILLDGCLYGANGGNEGGFLICLDFKTGNVLWDGRDDAQRRAPKGSVALADGRLYYRTEKGTMLLIEPNVRNTPSAAASSNLTARGCRPGRIRSLRTTNYTCAIRMCSSAMT